MAACHILQEEIYSSQLVDDNLNISNVISAATLEEDLNYIRSVLKTLHGGSTWYDVPAVLAGLPADFAAEHYTTSENPVLAGQHKNIRAISLRVEDGISFFGTNYVLYNENTAGPFGNSPGTRLWLDGPGSSTGETGVIIGPRTGAEFFTGIRLRANTIRLESNTGRTYLVSNSTSSSLLELRSTAISKNIQFRLSNLEFSIAPRDGTSTLPGRFIYSYTTNQWRTFKLELTDSSQASYSVSNVPAISFSSTGLASGGLKLGGTSIVAVKNSSQAAELMLNSGGVEPVVAWGDVSAAGVDPITVGTERYKVWHAGNDGSGSGMDSDTVDSLHASQFLRSDTSDVANGYIRFANTSSTGKFGFGTTSDIVIGYEDTSARNVGFSPNDGGGSGLGDVAGGDFYFDFNNNRWVFESSTPYVGNNQIWHAGNDGPGSGLDADTVDGYHAVDLGQLLRIYREDNDTSINVPPPAKIYEVLDIDLTNFPDTSVVDTFSLPFYISVIVNGSPNQLNSYEGVIEIDYTKSGTTINVEGMRIITEQDVITNALKYIHSYTRQHVPSHLRLKFDSATNKITFGIWLHNSKMSLSAYTSQIKFYLSNNTVPASTVIESSSTTSLVWDVAIDEHVAGVSKNSVLDILANYRASLNIYNKYKPFLTLYRSDVYLTPELINDLASSRQPTNSLGLRAESFLYNNIVAATRIRAIVTVWFNYSFEESIGQIHFGETYSISDPQDDLTKITTSGTFNSLSETHALKITFARKDSQDDSSLGIYMSAAIRKLTSQDGETKKFDNYYEFESNNVPISIDTAMSYGLGVNKESAAINITNDNNVFVAFTYLGQNLSIISANYSISSPELRFKLFKFSNNAPYMRVTQYSTSKLHSLNSPLILTSEDTPRSFTSSLDYSIRSYELVHVSGTNYNLVYGSKHYNVSLSLLGGLSGSTLKTSTYSSINKLATASDIEFITTSNSINEASNVFKIYARTADGSIISYTIPNSVIYDNSLAHYITSLFDYVTGKVYFIILAGTKYWHTQYVTGYKTGTVQNDSVYLIVIDAKTMKLMVARLYYDIEVAKQTSIGKTVGYTDALSSSEYISRNNGGASASMNNPRMFSIFGLYLPLLVKTNKLSIGGKLLELIYEADPVSEPNATITPVSLSGTITPDIDFTV